MSRKLLSRKQHTNAWFNSSCYLPPRPTPYPLRKVHHGNVFYMTFQSRLPGIPKRTISHPGNFEQKKKTFEIHLGHANCIWISSVFSFDLVETCIWRSVSSYLNVGLESAAHFSGRISNIQILVLLTFVETKTCWWLILQWQRINSLFRCMCRVQWNCDRKD